MSLAVLSVLAALTVPSGAEAATDLDGTFHVTLRVYDANDGTEGQVLSRTYIFTPLCTHAGCRKVVLRRESGHSGDYYRSILRRKPSGIYVGAEREQHVNCPGPGGGPFVGRFRFQITDREGGSATAFKGKDNFRWDCPSGDIHSKAKLAGFRL